MLLTMTRFFPKKSIESRQEWTSLNCTVRTESERYLKSTEKTEKETRFYIISLPADAMLINLYVRAHQVLENLLHWVLDAGFSEDASRKRAGFANYSLLNRIAPNLLKNDKTTKVRIRRKRLKVKWGQSIPYKKLDASAMLNYSTRTKMSKKTKFILSENLLRW